MALASLGASQPLQCCRIRVTAFYSFLLGLVLALSVVKASKRLFFAYPLTAHARVAVSLAMGGSIVFLKK